MVVRIIHRARPWVSYLHISARDSGVTRSPPRCARGNPGMAVEVTSAPPETAAPTTHARLRAWVDEVAELTQPDAIHWCDGSDAEWKRLTSDLVASGTLVQLDPDIKPNSFWGAS